MKYKRSMIHSLIFIPFVFCMFSSQTAKARLVFRKSFVELFNESPIVVLATVEAPKYIGKMEISIPDVSPHQYTVDGYESKLRIHNVYKGSFDVENLLFSYRYGFDFILDLYEGTYILFLEKQGKYLAPANSVEYARKVSPSIIGTSKAKNFESAIESSLEYKDPLVVAKIIEDIECDFTALYKQMETANAFERNHLFDDMVQFVLDSNYNTIDYKYKCDPEQTKLLMIRLLETENRHIDDYEKQYEKKYGTPDFKYYGQIVGMPGWGEYKSQLCLYIDRLGDQRAIEALINIGGCFDSTLKKYGYESMNIMLKKLEDDIDKPIFIRERYDSLLFTCIDIAKSQNDINDNNRIRRLVLSHLLNKDSGGYQYLGLDAVERLDDPSYLDTLKRMKYKNATVKDKARKLIAKFEKQVKKKRPIK